jgi:hypothetical protein
MGTPSHFTAEKLVVAVLLSRGVPAARVLSALEPLFGAPDWVSPEIPFDFTGYYREEMGEGIRRLFVSCERLVAPESLAGIKTATNALEDALREGGARRANLDPGLMALSRFVLATTKESAHRIPLAAGIYAEVTLLYHKGCFLPLEWTYPDYRSPACLEALTRIRGLYRDQLRRTQ